MAQNVVMSKSKLRGRRIYIQKDYRSEEQQVRFNLRQLSKNIKDKDKSIKVRLGEFCIFIDDRKFAWSNNNIVSFTSEDYVYLEDIFKKLKLKNNIIMSKKQRPTIVNVESTE